MKRKISKRNFKMPITDRVAAAVGKKEAPDYKDIKLLGASISNCGRIISAATNNNTSHYQRQLGIAIKRARFLALIPYTNLHALSGLPSLIKTQ